jgi:hypothetical protein
MASACGCCGAGHPEPGQRSAGPSTAQCINTHTVAAGPLMRAHIIVAASHHAQATSAAPAAASPAARAKLLSLSNAASGRRWAGDHR